MTNDYPIRGESMIFAIIPRAILRSALILHLLLNTSFAQDIAPGEIRTQSSTGGSGGSSYYSSFRGNQWTEKQNLSIENGKLRLPKKGQLSAVTIKWSDPIVDKLGHICTISGQLLIGSNASDQEPIGWQQVISAHLSRDPGKSPEWAKGVDSDTVNSHSLMVNEDGTFSQNFDLRETNSKLDENRNLQVGISLAEQTSPAPDRLFARTSSNVPVMENSIRMMTIPRGEEQSVIIKLIDKASGWPDQDSNAVDLIRASNALRELGREQALTALEQYAKLTSAGDEYGFRQSYIIYGIIQCTFEPARPNDILPSPKYFRSLCDRKNSKTAAFWPRAPMVISDDIPWLLGSGVALGGFPFSPDSDLKWVRRYATLRDKPLRPADNPLVVAHELMSEPRFARLGDYSRTAAISQLKEQSYAMVADLLPKIPNDTWDRPDLEGNWQMLLEESKTARLFWNESKNAYMVKRN